MTDNVKETAIRVAFKADKTVRLMQRRIAWLEWETVLLRDTIGYASDLIGRASWRTPVRGDVWKRAHVRRIAKIFQPKPSSPGKDGTP